MKCGIIEAISDCRLSDALLMLEHCQVTKPIEVAHGLVLNAMMDSDSAYAHALEAKIVLHQFSEKEFVK